MTSDSTLLTVIYYVEAGCLGSNGQQKISAFCQFLSDRLNLTNNELCFWEVHPLTDINEPHIEYFITQKKLNNEQAKRYLLALNSDIEHFENGIDDLVIDLIEEFSGR